MTQTYKLVFIFCALVCSINAQINFTPLDYMTQYTGFFGNDFSSENVDCQGRLAVGVDATLSNYEVGTLLPTNCLTFTLVVGNDVTYTNGNVAGGMIAYGNTASLTAVTDACGAAEQATVLNFAPIMNSIAGVSASIAQAPQQGSAQQYYSTLEIGRAHV